MFPGGISAHTQELADLHEALTQAELTLSRTNSAIRSLTFESRHNTASWSLAVASARDPPLCANSGSMPVTMLAVRIRAFCVSTVPGGRGPLVTARG